MVQKTKGILHERGGQYREAIPPLPRLEMEPTTVAAVAPKRSDAEIMGAADQLLAALMAAEPIPTASSSAPRRGGVEDLLANLGRALEANHAKGNGDDWEGKPEQNTLLWTPPSAAAHGVAEQEEIKFEVVTRASGNSCGGGKEQQVSDEIDALVSQFCQQMRDGQRQGVADLLPFSTTSKEAVASAQPLSVRGRTKEDAENMTIAELCEELGRIHAAKAAAPKSA